MPGRPKTRAKRLVQIEQVATDLLRRIIEAYPESKYLNENSVIGGLWPQIRNEAYWLAIRIGCLAEPYCKKAGIPEPNALGQYLEETDPKNGMEASTPLLTAVPS